MIENKARQYSIAHSLYSTGLISFSRIIQILLSIIKTKFTAIILGVSGVGILGIYSSILEIFHTLTSFGLDLSGVRYVSLANVEGKVSDVSKARKVLFRWSLFSGILGFLSVLVFAPKLSVVSFGNKNYTIGLSIAASSIIFTSLFQSYNTFLQGLREVKRMVIGAMLSSLISSFFIVILYIFFRHLAIPLSFVLSGFVLYLVYSLCIDKKYKKYSEKVSLIETYKHGIGLIHLGIFMVLNFLTTSFFMYIMKMHINKYSNLQTVGIFQAVYAITNTYLGVLINAMTAEYYPQLCKTVNTARENLNFDINQQLFITMILGNTCIIILLILSESLLELLYSSDFSSGTEMFILYLIGSSIYFLWSTLSTSFLAHNDGLLHSIIYILPKIAGLMCVLIFFVDYGLFSCGIAYVLQNFISALLTIIIAKIKYGFKFEKNIIFIISFCSFIITAYLFCFNFLFSKFGLFTKILIKIMFIIIIITFCMVQLSKKIDIKQILIKYISKKQEKL
jgi:O-antigen/teichoic acid export membrane protein